ncbi:MAG: peptide chain release factor N(5)-glutamine methyltransferase [Candidatus Moranbacteria bacterium]|nr:peptide chain release factor N(5)-glutamine methyltransferase [Candidatus Moranbacteria bacterium]
MTIQQLLRNSNLSPLDAEILLSFVLKKTKEYLLAHPEKKLTEPQARNFNSLLRRRRRGEPIAYLRSQKEFFGLDFFVDKNVLIPRPETELLVEEVINKISLLDPRFRKDDKLMLIDIGTGSGNIIISIIKNIPAEFRRKIKFYATDVSEKALGIAKKNAKKHGIDKYIQFVQSDLLEFFFKKKVAFMANTFIIANLPYVSPILYEKHRQGLRFEPKKALLSDNKGLRHYENLLKQIKKILFIVHCSLFTVLEISPEQKTALHKIVKDIFPKAEISFQKDLAGKWRMANIYIT